MKTKTPFQVKDPENKVPQDVIRHVQAMTDDVRQILSGGLSFADRQLPFQYVQIFVTSGQPTVFNMYPPFSLIGCIPIQTNGITITSFSSINVNGRYTATITMNQPTGTIGFLLVGVN